MLLDWNLIKSMASEATLAKDALHIYVGFAIQVLSAALFRKTLASFLPWCIVFAAELVNEGLDLWFGEEAQVQPWQVDGAQHDILNTMVLPTALLLLSRYAGHLFTKDQVPRNANAGLNKDEQNGDQ